MMIQANYGISAYGGIAAISAQRQTSHITQAMTAAAAESAEQVTISDAGKALAAREDAPTRPRTPKQEAFLNWYAQASPATVKEAARRMAESPSRIVYTLPPEGGDFTGDKLYSSGKFVDDAYINRVNQMAMRIDAQRQALYEDEVRKGTDPLEIMEKMIDFTNSQPYEYREATDQGYWADEVPDRSELGYGDKSNFPDLGMDAKYWQMYQSETLSGASALEILKKFVSFTNLQSDAYLEAIGWSDWGKVSA
ncbi:MAG: hypothetical protein IK051_06710 [Rhodocyclaceae bacterium]|nr:hypothetical protein [Rhodocyclaceae bacterium]